MSLPLAGRHVAVLLGGLSSEREVSLVSGAACATALETLGARRPWGPGSPASMQVATWPRC